MKTFLTKHQSVVMAQLAGSVVLAALLLNIGPMEKPVNSADIPSPFAVRSASPLAATVALIGHKNGNPVDDVTFPLDQDMESLSVDHIQFVLTPGDAGVSEGAPLDAAMTRGKRIFGYRYSDKHATVERQRRDEAASGTDHAFAMLFPGTFFASAEQRADGTYITDFELEYGVTFLDLSALTLTKNERDIVITNDEGTAVTVRNVEWCGNAVVDTGEACDDGNAQNGDGCSTSCEMELPTDSSHTVCENFACVEVPGGGIDECGVDSDCVTDGIICGNGVIEEAEQCDDGDTDSGDGCSSDCDTESGFTCSGEPSVCTENPVCGNGTVEQGEACDDGNTVGNDSCDNSCKFAPAPI